MPGEPKRRHSKSRKRTRRAAIKLSAAGLIVCKNCGVKTRPHMACIECGFYPTTSGASSTYQGKLVGKSKTKVTTAK